METAKCSHDVVLQASSSTRRHSDQALNRISKKIQSLGRGVRESLRAGDDAGVVGRIMVRLRVRKGLYFWDPLRLPYYFTSPN